MERCLLRYALVAMSLPRRCMFLFRVCAFIAKPTDVAVFGARTLPRSRDLKRRDGLHHNSDVRSMFYVFETLAVLAFTSLKASHSNVCNRVLRPMHGLHRHDFIGVRSTPLVLMSCWGASLTIPPGRSRKFSRSRKCPGDIAAHIHLCRA